MTIGALAGFAWLARCARHCPISEAPQAAGSAVPGPDLERPARERGDQVTQGSRDHPANRRFRHDATVAMRAGRREKRKRRRRNGPRRKRAAKVERKVERKAERKKPSEKGRTRRRMIITLNSTFHSSRQAPSLSSSVARVQRAAHDFHPSVADADTNLPDRWHRDEPDPRAAAGPESVGSNQPRRLGAPPHCDENQAPPCFLRPSQILA